MKDRQENHNLIRSLKSLAGEGEELINSGYEINTNSLEIAPALFDWILRCNSLISGHYGKNSDTFKEFTQAYTLRMSVNMLLSLAAQEQSEEALAGLDNSTMNNLLALVKPEQKKQTAAFLAEYIRELEQPHPDWDKVVKYLQESFDFNLPFGCELTSIAYSRYQKD